MTKGVLLVAAVLLAGCGSAVVVDRDRAATPPYDGPMDTGAVSAALECDGKAYRRAKGVYDDGLATVQSSAEDALDDYMRESGLRSVVPSDGYAVEREDDGRILFSYDVGGRTKIALFAADGVRDWDDKEGWGLREWAQCDPSELPPDVTDDLNIGVWEDGSGRRVPIDRVQSYQGAEHCSWTDITFLLVGPERKADMYVRDAKGELTEFLHTSFADDVPLPEGATDTGFRRDGRQLWIVPGKEAAYLVSLDEPEDVDRWPRAKRRIGCA